MKNKEKNDINIINENIEQLSEEAEDVLSYQMADSICKKIPWLAALFNWFFAFDLFIMGYSGEFVICKEFTGFSYYIAITIPGLIFVVTGLIILKFCKIEI